MGEMNDAAKKDAEDFAREKKIWEDKAAAELQAK